MAGVYNNWQFGPGSVGVRSGNYFYFLLGGYDSGKKFVKYDVPNNSWAALAEPPEAIRDSGSAMAWDGGDYIYVARGVNSKAFWRYSISSDSWEVLSDAPYVFNDGSDMVYINGYIYASFGSSNAFAKYNVSSGTWTILSSFYMQRGGAMAWDGDNYIYAFRGGGFITTFIVMIFLLILGRP
jgi:hypothetical protein